MKTIPTAKTFIINKLTETQPNSKNPPTSKQVEEWMIEFSMLIKLPLVDLKKISFLLGL